MNYSQICSLSSLPLKVGGHVLSFYGSAAHGLCSPDSYIYCASPLDPMHWETPGPQIKIPDAVNGGHICRLQQYTVADKTVVAPTVDVLAAGDAEKGGMMAAFDNDQARPIIHVC